MNPSRRCLISKGRPRQGRFEHWFFRAYYMVWALLLFTAAATAQKPVAELPRVRLDTTWQQPTGGKTWSSHTAEELRKALADSAPGDVIVLDAGKTYSGKFVLPAKDNPKGKWIYLISSSIANLPAGQRVSPKDAANMAKIVTPTVAPALQITPGANHWRLAGLEITSESTNGCQPNNSPPINCFSYFLVGPQGSPNPVPDSFTIDRCYLHGAPNIDLMRPLQANISSFALIDSYIDEIHFIGVEAQGVLAFWSPGPFKIVNNYIAAATENIMFGGAGGPANPYVASDIEIRDNYLFKPLEWVAASVTQHQMVIKNGFELKSAQRVLFDHNTIENVWKNGQNGFAIVLTVRSVQSGDVTVINDVTVTNNVLKNVAAGFNTLAQDDTCGAPAYTRCHNAGSQNRWYIANNLIQFYDPDALGGIRNLGVQFNNGRDRINGKDGMLRNVVFEHNTTVPAASKPCWRAISFSSAPAKPPYEHLTDNLWIVDNVLCQPPSGDFSLQGMTAITNYMGFPNTPPNDLAQRFRGNLIYSSGKAESFPHNFTITKPIGFADPAAGNFSLTERKDIDISGKPPGVDMSALPK